MFIGEILWWSRQSLDPEGRGVSKLLKLQLVGLKHLQQQHQSGDQWVRQRHGGASICVSVPRLLNRSGCQKDGRGPIWVSVAPPLPVPIRTGRRLDSTRIGQRVLRSSSLPAPSQTEGCPACGVRCVLFSFVLNVCTKKIAPSCHFLLWQMRGVYTV